MAKHDLNTQLGTTDVIWNLTDLYSSINDPAIKDDIQSCETEASAVKEESSPAKAILLKEGPLVLKGNFIMYDAEGKELVHPTTVSICTCGASKNHPFCDGTHNTIQKRNP